ncbi:hypothetical protein [Caulobacter segnis]
MTETRARPERFRRMTQQASDTPLTADLIDGQVLITGPNGLQGALTLEAAKASLAHLERALGAAREPADTYQKPLG